MAPAAVDALFHLLIAHDFLALTFPARPGVPDEARPVVSVTNPGGEIRTVARWANDRSPAFDVVYQALLDLILEAAETDHEQEVTVVALDTGEIFSTRLIEPGMRDWRNRRRDPERRDRRRDLVIATGQEAGAMGTLRDHGIAAPSPLSRW